MKKNIISSLVCASVLGGLSLAGCSKEGSVLKPLPLAEAPQAFDQAFKKANAETQASVREALEALRTTNSPKAVMLLQTLAADANLTPAQQQVAARGLMTANAMLQAAATNGDSAAAEIQQIRSQEK